ncbi:putative hexachlorocyclohexane dehydrochlorinase 1 [Luminiphilus syltensis NOR5-1B]|uniref:Putative hexachlorocyclohexane dehydrochlorinase 1 n=1 Tax=Luminiphilus syltensis NOR5-1B TaxID=565045 RepID=B8KQF4_9GAMM|nr:nuclear transport factor 2 family protein [Luminiphilus syltensis]EED35547.1 putative hexachlorocyclohexane dehydrochlorinase 1 [Luminiphilus syltensis NOR5-1B]
MLDSDDVLRRLDAVESRAAIAELAFNYCHGFDKRDFDRFLGIWWEDCIWHIGPRFGSFSNHEGIREAVLDVLWPAWDQSQHLTSNLVIEFDGADRANVLCDVDCMGLLAGSTEATFVGATYADKVERREGIWKIAERTVSMHFFNTFPGTELSRPTA